MKTMQTYFAGSVTTHKINSIIIQPSIQPATTNSSSPCQDILAVSDENNIQPKKKKKRRPSQKVSDTCVSFLVHYHQNCKQRTVKS